MFKKYTQEDYTIEIDGNTYITTPEAQYDALIIGSFALPMIPGMIIMLLHFI